MGRTIPSFRMLLNAEIAKWREFRSKLPNNDKSAFDDLLNNSKLHSSASQCALRTNVFESLCMAIILNNQKRLEDIAARIEQMHIGGSNEEI